MKAKWEDVKNKLRSKISKMQVLRKDVNYLLVRKLQKVVNEINMRKIIVIINSCELKW